MKGRELGILVACALDLAGISLFVVDSGQSAMRNGYIPLINWAMLCGLGAIAVVLIVVAKFR